MMSPMQSLASVMRNYTSMEGRASRSEYWWFFLLSMVLVIGVLIVEVFLALDTLARGEEPGMLLGIPTTVVALFFLVPSITVSVRRLHDINKSGLWYFITFVPAIGWIVFLILMVIPSDEARNSFGHPPGSDARPQGNAYATLYKPDAEEAAELKANRKSEISDYYRKHVLGEA